MKIYACAFALLCACSSGDEWSARWAERIDDNRIAVVWRQGCGDPSQDLGRVEATLLRDGSTEAGTGGEGAIHVLAKTEDVLWYVANGTHAVDLPAMIRHRVESNLASHPQIGPSSPSGPRVRGTAGNTLALAGTDSNIYLVSNQGFVVRHDVEASPDGQEQPTAPIVPVPDLRTDLVDDLRRPSAGSKRDQVFYVIEQGRPVSAGADRWLIVSGRDRHNLHSVGADGVAWSRAVADLASAPAGADTRLIWASDDDGLQLVVGSQIENDQGCRFTNALVRLNPQTGATMSTHALAPAPP